MRRPKLPDLLSVILQLPDRAAAEALFHDLLTPAERREFENRWVAAVMLERGRPYREIIACTGLSSTTIARTSRWLKGSRAGFRGAIARLGKVAID